MNLGLACVWPGGRRPRGSGEGVVTVVVVVAVVVAPAIWVSWQSLLAALAVEVCAAWLLAVLPMTRLTRLRPRS
ncbi:hypothetical protein [Streptomyces hydrogenans]|uniref:hypothetical protein n=1 Tax=Streptomyces hydrogenans TaxID=1873719 RepID=UPI003812D14E